MDDSFSDDEWKTEVKSVAEDIGFDVEQKNPRRLELSGEDWFRFGDLFNSLSEINQRYTSCSIDAGSLTVSCPFSEAVENEFISEEYGVPLQQFFEVSSETDMYEPFEYDIVDGVLEVHTNVNQISDDSEGSIVDHLFGGFPLQIQTLGYSELEEYEFVYRFLIDSVGTLDDMQTGFIDQLNTLDKLWLDCPICNEEQSVRFLSKFMKEFICENCWTPIPYVEPIEDRLNECYDVSKIQSEFDKLLQDGIEVDDDSYFTPVPDESIVNYENVKLFDISEDHSYPFLAVVDGFISFKYSLNSDEPFFNPDFGSGECTLCGMENVDHSISATFVGEWGMKGVVRSICNNCLDSLETDVEEAISQCHTEVSSHLI